MDFDINKLIYDNKTGLWLDTKGKPVHELNKYSYFDQNVLSKNISELDIIDIIKIPPTTSKKKLILNSFKELFKALQEKNFDNIRKIKDTLFALMNMAVFENEISLNEETWNLYIVAILYFYLTIATRYYNNLIDFYTTMDLLEFVKNKNKNLFEWLYSETSLDEYNFNNIIHNIKNIMGFDYKELYSLLEEKIELSYLVYTYILSQLGEAEFFSGINIARSFLLHTITDKSEKIYLFYKIFEQFYLDLKMLREFKRIGLNILKLSYYGVDFPLVRQEHIVLKGTVIPVNISPKVDITDFIMPIADGIYFMKGSYLPRISVFKASIFETEYDKKLTYLLVKNNIIPINEKLTNEEIVCGLHLESMIRKVIDALKDIKSKIPFIILLNQSVKGTLYHCIVDLNLKNQIGFIKFLSNDNKWSLKLMLE